MLAINSKDTVSALQTYLNRIPISSVPDIRQSPVLELKVEGLVRDAIHLLYEKRVSVALITDSTSNSHNTNNAAPSKLSDRYIGVINFESMVLWCIERIIKDEANQSKKEAEQHASEGFFTRLDDHPNLKQTKIGELAKFFLWDPFFPVHLEDDTLFHVLLLLSKHRLTALPVIERATNQVIGFISQIAVIKLLLRSSGLEWFDNIANVPLSGFRLQRKNSAYLVHRDQSISEALSVLDEHRVPAVAVVDSKTKELVGTVRKGDIAHLLEHYQLFSKSKTTALAEFIKMGTHEDNYENQQQESILRMDSPIIHKEADILKQVMVKMAETNSESSFLVDDRNRVIDTLTLKDLITEFAPPCMDSKINGGGFFEAALQETRCHFENGTMISDK